MKYRLNLGKAAAVIALALPGAVSLSAQSGSSAVPSSFVDDQRSMALEVVRRMSEQDASVSKRVEELRRTIEFQQRVNGFAEAWNTLLDDCAKGKWNPKQAKAARKAFERLVKSEGWLEDLKK